MKIIYDREKAISRKKEIDREVEEENERRKKENKKIGWMGGSIVATLIALIIGISIYLCLFVVEKDLLPLCIGFGFVLVSLVVIAAYVYFETELWSRAEADYPADVEYFLKTNEYNVLQVFAKKNDGGYHDIYADRENKDHKVETVCIGFLKDTIRADIPVGSEPIADLEAGEYRIPYVRKEKENEDYL